MKNLANIKTIIVDLDRTLLHTDKTLSTYTLSVLRKCKERGIMIMVATARPLRTAKPYCELLGCDAMVVSNGARVICGDRQTEYGISGESAERLLNALERHPELRITIETGDSAYSNKYIEDYETVITDDMADVVKVEAVLKMVVHLDKEDTEETVRKELTDDLYYSISNGYLMQIMSRSATKCSGIMALLDTAQRSVCETAYFGDDHDDIEPIKCCGIGVAVSNGIEEVKKAADYIAESNDEDGAARFIEQMILRETFNS